MSDNSIRDQLADLISDAYGGLPGEGGADAILEAGWRPPAAAVETAAQAELLPAGAILTDCDGEVWQRIDGAWCSLQTASHTSNQLMRFRPLTFVGVALPRAQAASSVEPAPLTHERLSQLRDDPDVCANEGERAMAEELLAARARIAELEEAMTHVVAFVAERSRFVQALQNCAPGNWSDYHRWSGHAEARRVLGDALGWPVGDGNERG